MAYATVDELMAFINKKTATADENTAMTTYLDAASVNIDRVLNVYREGFEYFAAPDAATERRFVARGGAGVRIDECLEVERVQQRSAFGEWENVNADNYEAVQGSTRFPRFDELPYNLLLRESDCWPGGRDARARANVRVWARWGYSETPPSDIVAACIEQAGRWFKRAQSAQSDTLADTETGTLLYTKALDPDVQRKLEHGRYYRPALGGW